MLIKILSITLQCSKYKFIPLLKYGFYKYVVYLFLWSDEHFLAIFVITFGWVQQQTHPKVMTEMFSWSDVHFEKK